MKTLSTSYPHPRLEKNYNFFVIVTRLGYGFIYNNLRVTINKLSTSYPQGGVENFFAMLITFSCTGSFPHSSHTMWKNIFRSLLAVFHRIVTLSTGSCGKLGASFFRMGIDNIEICCIFVSTTNATAVATTTNATAVAQGVKVMEPTNTTTANELVSRNQEIAQSLIQAHKEYAKLLEQAQRDLRELSERCFEYGDFDEE